MDVLQTIYLRNPWWLLLALQPFFLLLILWLYRRRQADAFADAELLPWVLVSTRGASDVSWWRQLVFGLAWVCLAMAMAGPRQLQRMANEDTSHYLKLQVVVDESYSMSARDILPSRIQRTVLELHDLINRLHQVRMGIIVYAAHAHVMVPPTTDKNILRQSVDALRVRQLPTEGSGLYNALQFAAQQFAPTSKTPGAILLVSDGGVIDSSPESRQRLQQLVSRFHDHNLHLYVLGMGTRQGAPLLNDQNGWLKYDGHSVVSRLAVSRLQQLATLGDGVYARVAADSSDWQALYDHGIARLALATERTTRHGLPVWHDLSPWFVIPGLLLLLISYMPWILPQHNVALIGFVFLIFAGFGFTPRSWAAAVNPDQAWGQYRAGHYARAAQEFARLPGYAARMAEAASWYRTKHYPRAATAYIQAVLDANNDTQRARALFNLGNSYYRQARYAQAASTYRDTLRYRPDFKSAKINLAYAQSLQAKYFRPPPVGGHAGTGSHSAPARTNTVVGKGRVSLDESKKSGRSRLPLTDNHQQTAVNSRLLQQAKPATNKVRLDKDTQWTYDITRAQDITSEDVNFPANQSVFWKRLYEAEEGFPAPLTRPKILPGVPPW